MLTGARGTSPVNGPLRALAAPFRPVAALVAWPILSGSCLVLEIVGPRASRTTREPFSSKVFAVSYFVAFSSLVGRYLSWRRRRVNAPNGRATS